MAPTRSLLALLLYTSAFLCLSLWISTLVARAVPAPYMDEEFHVPQTRAYCAGRWREWHPKITTFPGLYLTAVPYAQVVQALGQWTGLLSQSVVGGSTNATDAGAAAISPDAATDALCSVTVLRSINILYGALCIPLYFALLRTLHPTYYSARSGRLLLATAQLSLFPLSFFFLFLYYTDGASVFWALAFYLAYLRGHRFVGGLLGVAAVGVRQTNVAWVAFVMLSDIVHSWSQGDAGVFGEQHARRAKAALQLQAQLDAAGKPQQQSGEKESKISGETLHVLHPPTWSDVPRSLFSLILDCLRALPSLVVRHWCALLTCLAFAGFVAWNGNSVVVGDRDNHVFSRHFPQMLYFIAFAAGSTAPNWAGIGALKTVASNVRRHPIVAAVVLAAMGVAVHFFTTAHPFLLADNRHYPFYVWKNLFRRWSLFKYAALPLYLGAGAVMQECWSGSRARSRLFQLLYWAITALCLVPTPLLEPRYFLTPALLWMLHSAPRLMDSVPRTLASLVLYGLVNAATLYVFLQRPFAWGDGSQARFMW